jgi:predicted transcriptional regulator
MPNLSVKLDEATRQRLLEVAAGQGITPHAFMIRAIGAELEQAEAEAAFVARALRARAQVVATGQVIDGPAFADYLRCRVRGQSVTRPSAQAITERVETKA